MQTCRSRRSTEYRRLEAVLTYMLDHPGEVQYLETKTLPPIVGVKAGRDGGLELDWLPFCVSEDKSVQKQIWMTRLQELAQDVVHHLSHFYVGALLPMTGAGTGWYPWQSGAAAACILGVAWEVGGAIIVPPEKGWRGSAIGMLSFGAGAAVASALLLISGR